MKTFVGLALVAVSACASQSSECGTDDFAVWRMVPAFEPASATEGFSSAWTGDELLVWGGEHSGEIRGSGGRFRPISNTWKPIATAGAPSARTRATAVWTGTEFIVWGGWDSSTSPLADGARYDPAADRWTPMSATNAPHPRRDAIALWTGSEMLVVGGYQDAPLASYSLLLDDGALYDPKTNAWRPVGAPYGVPVRPGEGARGVWTGEEVVFWGATFDPAGQIGYDAGWAYSPTTQEWRTTAAANQPGMHEPAVAIASDRGVLVWGVDGADYDRSAGGIYNPSTDSWNPLPPIDITTQFALATDDGIIVSPDYGRSTGWSVAPRSGVAVPLPALGPAMWKPIAWTGSETIVWIDGANRGEPYAARLTLCDR